MRTETTLPLGVQLKRLAFLQYLWGIETGTDIPSTVTVSSFYSTYGELKLKIINLTPHDLNRFYSTYEELKPDIIKLCTNKPLSFYSTYEELKHFSCIAISTAFESFYSTYEELKLNRMIFYYFP